jgi:hypothetical protein
MSLSHYLFILKIRRSCTLLLADSNTDITHCICSSSKRTYCTMLRVLDHFWSPVVPFYATEDAVQIGNSFIYNLTHVTTITHNYFLCCVTFTQLTILHIPNPYSICHTVFLTHFLCLSPIETSLAEQLLNNSPRQLLLNNCLVELLLKTDSLDIPVPLI